MSGHNGDAKPQFAAMPVRAMSDKGLTATDLRALMVVARHDRLSRHKGTQGAWIASGKMAEIIGCDLTAFSRSISRLVERGYIIKERMTGSGMGKGKRITMRVVYDDETGFTCATSQQNGEGIVDNPANSAAGELDTAVSKTVEYPPFEPPQEITLSLIDSAEAGINSGEPARFADLLSSPQYLRNPVAILAQIERLLKVDGYPIDFADLEHAIIALADDLSDPHPQPVINQMARVKERLEDCRATILENTAEYEAFIASQRRAARPRRRAR